MLSLIDYGFLPQMLPENAPGIPARVTAVHRERCQLICAHGALSATLRPSDYYEGEEPFPVTGDFVLIQYVENGESRILKTLPRRTLFSRRSTVSDPRRAEQAVAANFDTVFILQSLNQDFNLKRLERYLTLAWQSGAAPVVLLTKADLIEDAAPYIRAAEPVASPAPVLAVSAKSGAGLERLAGFLQPRQTVAFLGSSGVGKSSLVNALAGEEIMDVSGIRDWDGRGRHTTTHRQLVMLKSGAMVIDTPGMRELGMWDVSEGLGDAFADVEQYLGRCRFPDCRHLSEPGCAIRAALESGALSPERWQSYQALKSEAQFTDDKNSYRQQKRQRNRALAMQGRARKRQQRRGKEER